MKILSLGKTFYHQNRPTKFEVHSRAKDCYSCSTKLLEYLFVVEYKQGSENKVVDALSRRSDLVVVDQSIASVAPPSSLCLISFPCLSWIDELKASYHSDPTMQSLFQ